MDQPKAPDRFIVAVNVKIEGKVVMLGAVWNGSTLVTVRAKAAIFTTAEDAESQRFYISCKYPLMMGRIEVLRLEDDQEFRYHLRGGEDIKTE